MEREVFSLDSVQSGTFTRSVHGYIDGDVYEDDLIGKEAFGGGAVYVQHALAPKIPGPTLVGDAAV